MCYSGFNQEDSLIINKASVDRDLFTSECSSYEETELDKNESFMKPNEQTEKNSQYDYSLLD